MSRTPQLLAKLFAEPTVRFFVVGALLFVAHRLVVGDARVIAVTPGLKAELARRFRDSNGRPPSAPELEGELGKWKRDEVLYREALRDGLDRDDATIRAVLADRVRARVAVGILKREPSQADLDAWLATHRSLYETPRRYDYALIAFAKTEAGAAEARAKVEQALKQGTAPSALGRPLVGGVLTAEELQQRVGPALAARIQTLPVGVWQRADDDKRLLLVRLTGVEGGLPPPDVLRARLVTDWAFAERQRAVDAAVQAIAARYRFVENR